MVTDDAAADLEASRAIEQTISTASGLESSTIRRLRQISRELAGDDPAAGPEAGSGPGGQGFGPRAATQPPHFAPSDVDSAVKFFDREGYVVFKDALTKEQLAHLNGFCDRTQAEDPVAWEIPTDGRPWTGARYSQPFLDTDEIDYCAQLDTVFPFVTAVLGEGNARFAEFNLRDTPPGAGTMKMNFHHDAALRERLHRKPYRPCDWLCSICYLTDVGADEPAFCVVPKSVRTEPIEQAKRQLGSEYVEQPLYGPAGTCIFYDIALYHTRIDSLTGARKRQGL
jgi:ectoine hydroxylase-related dioxygenase (phytanoyl-CoA dioxygenase family)